ncbi:MAG: hypothetical protein ABL999_04835 [Pyrinomonadaceae bacterium]
MRKTVTTFFSEHQGRLLQGMLAVITVLFIGILITTYFVAKSANPIFLDEKGRPIESQSGSRSY